MNNINRHLRVIVSACLIFVFLFNAVDPISVVAAAQSSKPTDNAKPLISKPLLIERMLSWIAWLDKKPTDTPEPLSTPLPTETEVIPTATEVIPTSTEVPTLSPTLEPTSTTEPTQDVTHSTPLLSFTFSVNPEQATPGDEVTFTAEITNNSETAVSGLIFSNKLPEEFGNGKSGFEEFSFDQQSRLLIWEGEKKPGNSTQHKSDSDTSQSSGAILQPGESLTLAYSVQVDANLGDVQMVDSASLLADGLAEPLTAEATLLVLSSDKHLTELGPEGGTLLGLDGKVKVEIPKGALKASNKFFIQDLRQDSKKASEAPPLVFSLDLYALQHTEKQHSPKTQTEETLIPAQETPTVTEQAVSPEVPGDESTDLDELTPTETESLEIPPEEQVTPETETTQAAPLQRDLPAEENDQISPLKPKETTFDQLVKLTVSLDGLVNLAELSADLEPYLVTFDENSQTWVHVPLQAVDRQANTISAETQHFSTWGAGLGPTFPQNGANVLLFDKAKPDLFTGRARYSLPIWTPSGRNGIAPSLALSYFSGVADGVLGDVQAPWVGMGWSIDSIEVARKIVNGSCSPCGGGSYGYENKFLLLFNGAGYELLPDGSTPGRYHTKAENFFYIQLHNDSLGNNSPAAQNASGEWWEVVETDGTRWRIGWNADSEQLAAMKGYPGAATGAWAALGYAGHASDVVALRWRADLATDTFGNTIAFSYFEETRLVNGTSTTYDRASYLDMISYTGHTSGNPAPGYSIVFVRESRGGSDVPAPENDWDNWDSERLDRIEVRYGTNVVRTYDLSYDIRSYTDDSRSWQTTVLTSVAVSGAGTSAPTATFSYADKDNRANCGTGCQEWAYPRLSAIANGWGANASFVYGNDGRTYTSWYNWRVETMNVADGVSVSPMKTVFAYVNPCYQDASAGWCNASNIGELVGYGQTTVTDKDFNGTTTLAIAVHKSYTDAQKVGMEYETQQQDASGTILSQTNTTFSVSTAGLPAGGYFAYASAVENYLRSGGSLNRVSRMEYSYDTSTGNLTLEKQYDGTPTLYRQTGYEYITNSSPAVWIMDKVARQYLKDAAGTIVSEQLYGYDGSLPGSASPTPGALTLRRIVSGSQTIDTGYVYDSYGNLTEARAYTAYGSLGSQPGGSYRSGLTAYDPILVTYPISSSNPLGHVNSMQYDYALGVQTTATEPNGNTTTTSYDGLGRTLSMTLPGYTQPNVRYTYPALPVSAPFAIQMEAWDEPAGLYRSAWQMYDGLGRVLQTQAPYQTAGELTLSDTSYNALGQTLYSGLARTLSGTGGNYFAPNWASVPHTTTSYDALGRTSSVVYADSSQETTAYSGLRTTSIDRSSHQKIREIDAFGRLIKVEEYSGAGSYSLYAITTYAYDRRDLLTQVTDTAGNQTAITHDGFGRKSAMTDPDMGGWSYVYDVLGNLTSQTDARGCVTTVTYDALNRPTSKSYSGPGACATTPPVTYTYDDTTSDNQGLGRRTAMSDGSGATNWFYNALGQVTNETRNVDGTPYTISSSNDAFGRPLTQTLPSGEALAYGYNAMGALASLSGTTSYLANVHYNASGQVSDQQLGNNILQQSCYEANTLRLSSLRAYPGSLQACGTNPSNARLNLSYTYQPNGNISQMVDAARNETVYYAYDELDRLTSAGGSYNQSFSYNSIGNMVSKSTPPLLTAIAAGWYHTCALTRTGGVKCWGDNTYGQLGDGTTAYRLTPVEVSGLTSGVTAIATGYYHTCALTSAGGVKCWGLNAWGQLGDGTTTQRLTPVDVSGLISGVIAIAAGRHHTCALTSAGGVKCWGNNDYGNLGDGTTTQRLTPVNVSGLTGGVTNIATGVYHTCALTNAGGARCWGHNGYGQLGDGTTNNHSLPVEVSGLTSGVTAISSDYLHNCALTSAGGIKCWGYNEFGQVGDGTTTNRTTPINVSGLTSGVSAIAAGTLHTCALTSAGGLRCWGHNGYGQVGDGTTTNRTTPVNVSGLTSGVVAISSGYLHTCALTSAGGVKCWGYNAYGQLGDGTTTQRLTPVEVSGLTGGVTAIAAGGHHACALTSAGGVKCWGYNPDGELGDGTTNNHSLPVEVSGLTSGVTAIAAGYLHTCALTSAGGVKCWGYNEFGQVGDGTTTNRLTPVNVSGLTSGVTAIAVGSHHTCALTSSGGVKCWGNNGSSQLGDGTTTQRLTPVNVSGLTSGVTAIAAGWTNTCALTITGGVKCWGLNNYGQLGDGTTTQRLTPVDVSGLTSGVTAIAAGGYHACALTSAGGLKCWGLNNYGQLGDGTTTQRLTPVDVSGLTGGVAVVSAGCLYSCVTTSAGGLKCWGHNYYGQLGDGTTTNRSTPIDVSGLTSGVAVVSAGYLHTCAATSAGGVKCWGYNAYGQIGVGDTSNYSVPVTTISPADNSVIYTYGSAAHKHAVTVLSSGDSYQYDANGNMIQRVEGGVTYSQVFDAENRLVSVTVNSQTTQFAYDGDGNLVKKIQPDGSRTIYIGGIYEVRKDSAGTAIGSTSYYPVAGAMRVDGTLYYVLKDQLGSASVVLDSSGNVVGEQRYYPFGEMRLSTGNMFTDRLYTGQRELTGLGLYNYNARFYSPKLGRFIQPDTIVPGAGNPQAYNRYSYVLNNPIKFNDPSGHMFTEGSGGSLGGRRYNPYVRVLPAVATKPSTAPKTSAPTPTNPLTDDQMKNYIQDQGIKLVGNWTRAYLVNLWDTLFKNIGQYNLSQWLNGKPVTLKLGGTGNCNSGFYAGVTSASSITFYNNNHTNPVINMLHEFGHLFDNLWGDYFTKNLERTTFIDPLGGYLAGWDGSAYNSLPHSKNMADVRYTALISDTVLGQDAWQQYQDPGEIEDWADIFANAMIGNINLTTDLGEQMNDFFEQMDNTVMGGYP